MNNGPLPRIGTFLLLVGVAFLVLFLGSILAREVHALYILYAAVAIFFGIALRGNPPKKEPTRFVGIRNARARSRQRREEKKPGKPEKK
jgi:hypothetical protein